MKVKIKDGKCPDYLSHNTEYYVLTIEKKSFFVRDNSGDIIEISINNCEHLNGGSWEIVEAGEIK